jgi:hypothetical protein
MDLMQAKQDDSGSHSASWGNGHPLSKINPTKYEQYIRKERRENKVVLYGKLNKASYGTLQAAPLLLGEAFEINPYAWCLAKKTVTIKVWCAIVWHVC